MDVRRPGMTLGNWIVTIAIIALGLGILLQAGPWLGFSREAARRAQCINNVKNIDLALQNFVSAQGAFPNAGTYEEDPAALASGDPKDSVINDAFNGRFGTPRPGHPAAGPLHSWVIDVLPYLDKAAIDRGVKTVIGPVSDPSRSYLDPRGNGPDGSAPSNLVFTSSDIPSLICPDDTTALSSQGKGNQSYAVNGGFSRWHAEGHAYGWEGTAKGGDNGPKLDWGQAAATRTGVMFLGTSKGDAPWDYRTTTAAITDGLATTVLVAENIRAGFSPGSPATGNLPTNWACPHPNFAMVLASDDVCTRGRADGTNCSNVGDLAGDRGWARANTSSSDEGINSGLNKAEGASPFPNSGHPGLVIVGMCDGSVRTLNAGIDGAVWAKLMTPAGESLPAAYRQNTLSGGY